VLTLHREIICLFCESHGKHKCTMQAEYIVCIRRSLSWTLREVSCLRRVRIWLAQYYVWWHSGSKLSGYVTDNGLDPSSFFDVGPPNVYYRIFVVFNSVLADKCWYVNALKHARNHSLHHVALWKKGSIFEMVLLNKVRSKLLWNVNEQGFDCLVRRPVTSLTLVNPELGFLVPLTL